MSTGTRVLLDKKDRPTVQQIRVEVRRGPDKGKDADLGDEPIRIGTSPGCQFSLTDPTVSGIHAELSRTRHGVLIRDLGSTNGTFIDDRRVQGVFVEGQTNVRLGNTELRMTPLSKASPVEIAADDRVGELVGSSMTMRAVFARLKRLAASDSTVLVTGETGTGKELAAGAIRDLSKRRSGPLVVVDCGALPANLIESELFGHERGAFTGAERTRPGAFERASGGTIFLDEIGELPLTLQPALLGILERRESRRVGGQQPIAVDVRVITATNRNLAEEVSRGAFRADLYYRLAVVELRLPPLREHPDDIPLLVEHFLGQLPGERPTISAATLEQLRSYAWPGNVRELKNVIERAALLAEAPQPRASEPVAATAGGSADIEVPFKEQKNSVVAAFERAYVQQLITATSGNIAAAARKARIDRMYLYKLLDRYQIDPNAGR
ncbi:MAG: sigma 54-interacting transcriptional regulator [Deltaproteobacteria bacterium]|nr:sigma 54-interacting transcriptional regulator [Deltaproteobacteria bacterium]